MPLACNLPTWAKHSMPSTWIYPVKLLGSGCPVSLLCGPHEPHDSYDSSGLRGQSQNPSKVESQWFPWKKMDVKTFTAQNITPIATIFTNKAKATSIWPCGTGQLKISCSSETTRWEIWSWFWLRNFLRISLTASFSRSLTHSLVKRPHQQSSPVYRAWLCCSGFCPQLRSVLHLAWWVSRTYPTPLRDKVKQRIVLQTISAPANLQFLKLEQWTHWLYHFHPSLKALPLNYHDTISPYLIKRKSYLHALSIQPACHIPFFRTLGIFKICKILTVQCTPAPGVLVHLGDSRFLDGLDRLDGGFGSLGVPEVYNFIQHKNPQEQSQKF